MPYRLTSKDGKVCVVKKDDGSVVKCHDSREDAEAHLKALYANKADASVQACIDELDGEEALIASGGLITTTATTNVTNLNITAHAEPARPPTDHFSIPPTEFQRRYTTITEDGRVMGLLATFDECHVSYGDVCITAPREADYSHFAVGTVITSDGSSIPTGVIALNGGHADSSLDAASARAHYDNPETAIVDVVVGASELGIWYSGTLRPGATPAQVHALRASGVSGDWRLIDGQLRLVGICSVNVPGFPKLTVAASAEGITALVAAGGPPLPHPDLCDCKDMTQDILDELDSLQRIVADAGIENVAIEKLAARITPSNDEIDALFDRVS